MVHLYPNCSSAISVLHAYSPIENGRTSFYHFCHNHAIIRNVICMLRVFLPIYYMFTTHPLNIIIISRSEKAYFKKSEKLNQIIVIIIIKRYCMNCKTYVVLCYRACL